MRNTARKELHTRIERRQKLSDDEMAKIDKKYAECLKKIDLIDNELEENRRNPSPSYTPEKMGQLYTKRRAHVYTYTDERQR